MAQEHETFCAGTLLRKRKKAGNDHARDNDEFLKGGRMQELFWEWEDRRRRQRRVWHGFDKRTVNGGMVQKVSSSGPAKTSLVWKYVRMTIRRVGYLTLIFLYSTHYFHKTRFFPNISQHCGKLGRVPELHSVFYSMCSSVINKTFSPPKAPARAQRESTGPAATSATPIVPRQISRPLPPR